MGDRAERFSTGSATELSDAQGTTYQVSAYESALRPLEKTVTDSRGASYQIAENGKSVIRTNADGTTFTYARYDATTQILLIILWMALKYHFKVFMLLCTQNQSYSGVSL